MARLAERFPSDMHVDADARHDRPRDRGREGDRHHAARGDRARHPGRLRLPPELAGHAHPDPHHSGLPRRHLPVLPDDRVLDQHALAPWARARGRPRRRRRDRRGRGDRGEDRAGPVPARRGAPGDGRGERRARRHRARALERVHSRRLHRRHHRVALPAVRAHHRVLGPDLRLQRAHAEPRARRAASSVRGARTRAADSLGRFFAGFDRAFDVGADGLRPGRAVPDPQGRGRARSCSSRSRLLAGGLGKILPDVVHAAGGPGLLLHERAASRGRVDAADERRHARRSTRS